MNIENIFNLIYPQNQPDAIHPASRIRRNRSNKPAPVSAGQNIAIAGPFYRRYPGAVPPPRGITIRSRTLSAERTPKKPAPIRPEAGPRRRPRTTRKFRGGQGGTESADRLHAKCNCTLGAVACVCAHRGENDGPARVTLKPAAQIGRLRAREFPRDKDAPESRPPRPGVREGRFRRRTVAFRCRGGGGGFWGVGFL